jgi:hypothetical protein
MRRPILVLTAFLYCAPVALAQEVAPPLGAETLQSFDYRQAELRWQDRRWQLVAGGIVLKDFGHRERDAHEALRVLRQLHVNQRGSVGSPYPVMEYWLADGHAPQGLLPELHPQPVDQASLRVEQAQGQWWVRDNARGLFNFGAQADEARQALAILRHYGFTQVAAVGRPAPDLVVLLGGGNPPAVRATPSSGPSALAPAPLRLHPFPPAREPGPQAPGSAAPRRTDAGVMHATFQQPAGPAGAPPASPAGATPAPPAAPDLLDAERVPVDWQRAGLRQDADGWKLVAGTTTLANFGSHDRDARLALAAVRYYRFTEHGAVGHPQPLFSYFLVNGQAPRGAMLGLQHDTFHPQTLAVRQTGDGWGLYDGARPILNFGDHPDEARQALRIIRRYQFDTLCRAGQPDAGAMTFFVRAR